MKFGAAVSKPGVFSARTIALLRDPIFGSKKGVWSYGWFANPDSAGRRMIHINGGQPGVQSALYVYPDEEIAVAIITNTWGVDARAAVMATTLPQQLAQLCREHTSP